MAGPLRPGVWVGSWRIVMIGGVRAAGSHHTALALVERDGTTTVYELIGWLDYTRSDIMPRPWPFYGHFSSYRWFQVANVHMIPACSPGSRSHAWSSPGSSTGSPTATVS